MALGSNFTAESAVVKNALFSSRQDLSTQTNNLKRIQKKKTVDEKEKQIVCVIKKYHPLERERVRGGGGRLE